MLLALLLCYAGFVALCLSLDRHHGELLHSKPSPQRRLGLRGGGGSFGGGGASGGW